MRTIGGAAAVLVCFSFVSPLLADDGISRPIPLIFSVAMRGALSFPIERAYYIRDVVEPLGSCLPRKKNSPGEVIKREEVEEAARQDLLIARAANIARFYAIDLQGRGYVSIEETREFCGNAKNAQKCGPNIGGLEEFVEQADRNGDGKLDFREYRDLRVPVDFHWRQGKTFTVARYFEGLPGIEYLTDSSLRDLAGRIFDAVDINHDGKVTGAEVVAAFGSVSFQWYYDPAAFVLKPGEKCSASVNGAMCSQAKPR